MENVGLMIKGNLGILLAIRECYFEKFKNIDVNANTKTHVLIYIVYNAVVPELLKELYRLLNLHINNQEYRYSVKKVYLKLSHPNYLHGINHVYLHSENKSAVLKICSYVDFFTKECYDALELLNEF